MKALKPIFFLLVIFLHTHLISAQCVPIIIPPDPSANVTKSIEDFGGYPDDGCSDHAAFVEAAAWFTARHGHGELLIPAGVYIVGNQFPSSIYYRGWERLMEFDDCHQMYVTGVPDADGKLPVIKYKDCLLYGAFVPESNPVERYIPECGFPLGPNDPEYAAAIGSAIFLEGCSKFTIRHIELDGNSTNMILGGGHASDETGIQLPHSGIVLGNGELGKLNPSYDIVIEDVNAHHFGQDGITLWYGSPAFSTDLEIYNSHFDWNGRNGMSWLSGYGITVENSTFDYNALGRVHSKAADGLDIEPGMGGTPANGTFTDCSFKHNLYSGMECNQPGISGIENIRFDNCIFKSSQGNYKPGSHNVGSTCVSPKASGFTFEDCQFYGPIMWGYNAPLGSDECNLPDVPDNYLHFISCSFNEEDDEFSYINWNGDPWIIEHVSSDYPNGWPKPALLHMEYASRAFFENCTVTTNCLARIIWVVGGSAHQDCTNECINNAVFKECTLVNLGMRGGYNALSRVLVQGDNLMFIDSDIIWPNEVRSYDYNNLNYYPNDEGFGTVCGNPNFVIPRPDLDEEANPCLPSFINPSVGEKVRHCAGNGPLTELCEWTCAQNKKSHEFNVKNSSLNQNQPNPFSHLTVINFSINHQFENARIDFYSIDGKHVHSQRLTTQQGSIEFNAQNQADGIYIYRLVVDGTVIDAHQLVISKN